MSFIDFGPYRIIREETILRRKRAKYVHVFNRETGKKARLQIFGSEAFLYHGDNEGVEKKPVPLEQAEQILDELFKADPQQVIEMLLGREVRA